MATVTFLKSDQAVQKMVQAALQGVCGRGASCPMSRQRHWVLGECKLCRSTQNSSGGLWVWILYNWQCVYCTGFYVFTCIPKHFFNKSADPASGDGNPFPAVYFSSWFCLLYTFKIVHVNQCKFSSSNFQI